jgi:hypothetical protein
VHDRFETRLVRARRARELDGTRGDGRWLGWMRFAELDAAAPQLAMVSDLAIGALWQGVGSFVGVRTVSSTLTVTGHDATGWLLADMRLEAVDADLAHLRTHLWSEDARLLGLSTTTLTMRAGTPSR